jgi:acyl carrier protein phosphodiesterase
MYSAVHHSSMINGICKFVNCIMNYLAHAYLSFRDPSILAGNMISDYVKGKKKFDYPERVQEGIMLHRFIDQFTDDHPVNHELQKIFKPHYGLYSGPIVDVILDYFVANDVKLFDPQSLMEFSLDVYEMLDPFQPIFPEKFSRMFPYMRSQNWLYHYQFQEGIWNSLGGLARRAKYINETGTAFRLYMENIETIQAGYNEFFPELQKMTLSAVKPTDPV